MEPAQIFRHRHIVCVTRFACSIHGATTKPNRSNILCIAIAIQPLLNAVPHNSILSLRATKKLIWRHALAKCSLSPGANIFAHNLIAAIGTVRFTAWANHVPSNRIITTTGLNRTQSVPDAFDFWVQFINPGKPRLLCVNNFAVNGIPMPHASKPDIDNLAKAVMDAMGDCDVWADDAQVAELHASKQYADEGGDCGCDVTVTPLGR